MIRQSLYEKRGRKRAMTLFPSIGVCVRCGAAKAERHHIDGDTWNNNASNIEALCRRCHMAEDGRLAAQIASARDRQKVAAGLAASAKLARIHCKNGHRWADVGWLTKQNGARICKECARGYKARYLAKRAL